MARRAAFCKSYVRRTERIWPGSLLVAASVRRRDQCDTLFSLFLFSKNKKERPKLITGFKPSSLLLVPIRKRRKITVLCGL